MNIACHAGGAILLQSNFTLEDVDFAGNSAFFGGAIFISANLAADANLDSINFTMNTAALGAPTNMLLLCCKHLLSECAGIVMHVMG